MVGWQTNEWACALALWVEDAVFTSPERFWVGNNTWEGSGWSLALPEWAKLFVIQFDDLNLPHDRTSVEASEALWALDKVLRVVRARQARRLQRGRRTKCRSGLVSLVRTLPADHESLLSVADWQALRDRLANAPPLLV